MHSSICDVFPQESYLNFGQLLFFQERLSRAREEICKRLQSWPVEIVSEGLSDWIDTAAVSTMVELSWAERERVMVTIRQIDDALARIAAGSYGYCVETGEEIGLERLMAMPTARFSVETQKEIERRGKRFR